MNPVRHFELDNSPIDPNRARLWAIGLSLVALLIAVMTIKSNYDYFAQYFDGFAFWARVIPFFGVEATIIALPSTIGWGNRSQIRWAMICEVILIILSLVHTSLVGQSIQAKLQASKTKAEAQGDFEKTKKAASEISNSNQKLQDSYNQQMRSWRAAANLASQNNLPAPPPPVAPQLQAVPQIKQELVDNATMSVEDAAESQVNHTTLLRLLYAMIGVVIFTVVSQVKLSDSFKVKVWLLGERATEIKEMTHQPTEPSKPRKIKSPSLTTGGHRTVVGFSQPQDAGKDMEKDTDTKTGKDCIEDGAGLCLSTIRQRLKILSSQNPGMSFKVDGGRRHVLIRAMRAEQGRQVTQATLKLSPTEAQRLIEQPEGSCRRDLVSQFAGQNLHLKGGSV